MGYHAGNITKSSFQSDIKKKQALFNRFKRRYKVSKDPGEKRFLKAEATRIVNELKQCSKKWKNYGFGGCVWITKNYTVTCFTSPKSTWTRKSTARKSTTRKSSTYKPKKRCYPKQGYVCRSKGRSRKSYVAW